MLISSEKRKTGAPLEQQRDAESISKRLEVELVTVSKICEIFDAVIDGCL